MSDRDLKDCCLELQGIIPLFISQCAGQGITVKPIVTWRSAEEQNSCKANGLSNAAAGQSPHNHTDQAGNPDSLAIDFGIFEADGSYVMDGHDPRYAQAGAIAKGLGLVWGGDFKNFKDPDHLELPNWRNL